MDNQQIKNFIETSRQSGISDDKIVSYLQTKGVNLQGQPEPQKTFGQKALDVAKSTVGGFASGVGGIALTAEDYLARKGAFGEKVKTAMEGQPSLQQQFKKEMGGEENPTAYGIGQLGGEIAALATPVGELGKVVGTGAEAIGAGKNVAKLAQAGTEGIAFTAGQSLTEGEKMPLKDYAINAGLNMLIPAGGIVSKKVGENLPSRIVNSLIKPLQKDFAYGKNPGKVIAEKGIIANNFEELITKVKQAKDETGNLIGELRSKSTTPITLDAESVITPIDQAIAKANLTPRTNAALVQRLESVRQDILDNLDNGLPPEKVKSLVGDLTKWTGNATDDQLVNKSLKGVYSSINSQMDNALKTGLSPEDFAAYKKANEQYGDLISAENASVYRDKILERQDLISFGAKNAGLITALSTAIATGGSAIPTILAGLGGTILDKTMATPAFKTRLAVLLSKLAPAEVNTFFDRVPTAKTIFKKEELDNLINRVKETPNKQGGFVKLPYEGSNPKATTESLTTAANKTAKSNVIPKSSPKSAPKSSLKGKGVIPETNLITEAKKYKSAEEFVSKQNALYHGSDSADIIRTEGFKLGGVSERSVGASSNVDRLGKGIYFADDANEAARYARSWDTKDVVESFVKPGVKIKEFPDYQSWYDFVESKNPKAFEKPELLNPLFKKEGFDGVKLAGDIVIFDPKNVLTKSQLEEIWKKANSKANKK